MTEASQNALMWFRQDLRLQDNPALTAANEWCQNKNSSTTRKLFPLYILDDENPGSWKAGGAKRWCLHHSLQDLAHNLNETLAFFAGDPLVLIPKLVQELGIQAVFWNRCYEPFAIKRDSMLKAALKKQGLEVFTYNASLLWEPWDIKKEDGTAYKVFTPFFKKGCLNAPTPPQPLDAPQLSALTKITGSESLETLFPFQKPLTRATNKKEAWHLKLEAFWTQKSGLPSEKTAHKMLQSFLKSGLLGYKEGRNMPASPHTSILSSFLSTGEISPRHIWYEAQKAAAKNPSAAIEKDLRHFQSELAWREFSYSLLYQNPTLPSENLQKKFDTFPWRKNQNDLEKWQKGQTGFPFVDAGMRQLWQTGFMHNRLRMVTASFLIKHLMIHWREGEAWFWDCLTDADLANNSASWQWVAGSGADAAPYFRIFNPTLQGQKFDPDGAYTKMFLPELQKLPVKYLFEPWKAPTNILEQAGVTLGQTYPNPIIDLTAARHRALDAFQALS